MHDIRLSNPELDMRVHVMLPNAFGCPLEVEGRSMLLKIWHTYDTGLRLFKPDPP